MRRTTRRTTHSHGRLPAPIALLTVLLLVLSACGGNGSGGTKPSAAKPRPTAAKQMVPTKGSCWSAEHLPAALGEKGFAALAKKYAGTEQKRVEALRDDAAFTEPKDCAAPHELEVYNVVSISPALAAKVTSYTDLLDRDSALYREIRNEVNDRCVAGTPYARAERDAGNMPAQLAPALAAESGLHLAWDPVAPGLWEGGQRQFVCTFEQEQPGTVRFADLATRRAPAQARVCVKNADDYVPCSEPHTAEAIGEMILNTAISKKLVNAQAAVKKTPEGTHVTLAPAEYARLDKVCQSLLDRVSRKSGRLRASAYPGSIEQWPTPRGSYIAICFAVSPDNPPKPLVGTVFNKA